MWNTCKLADVSFYVTPHLKLRVLHNKLVLHCCIVLYSALIVAYKRSPNLRDLYATIHAVIHAHFYKMAKLNVLSPPLKKNETSMALEIVNCKSRNLIYLMHCTKCKKQYTEETKRQLNERFRKHRRSIQNHDELICPTPVSTHFSQPGHSINDILLIPLERIQKGW